VTESNFDRIAQVYDESLPAHVVDHYLEKRTRFVLEHCPRGSALDVGCGTGALAARLADEGYEVVGLDPSEGMLRVLEERRSRVRAVRGSGSSIPFPDASFDLVFSVATMHHIAAADDVRRTLAEMVRVTCPGGRVLVWDHNPRNPYWRLLMARVPQDTGEERLIGVRELVRGLTDAGADPLLVTQLGMVPDFTPRALLAAAATAERAAERIPLLRRVCAHNVVLVAKR
jgi:ubiquinone/menaquinone biosynthesis C-methylase UbiE